MRRARPPPLDFPSSSLVHRRTQACIYNYGMPSIFDSSVCAAGDAAGGEDSCQGDSGGPLWVEDGGTDYLVGVVSWGCTPQTLLHKS